MPISKKSQNIDRQIIALGGGGFSYTGKTTLIDKYILSLAPYNPKICFLPTASGDAKDYVNKFYSAFCMENCYMSHFSVFASNHEPEFS